MTSKQFEYLNLWQRRVDFTEQEKFIFYRQTLGDEGERVVSEMIQGLIRSDYYWLEDLYFKHFSGHVQIDGLLISDQGVYLLEVKNLVGEYVYEDGVWRKNGYELDRDYFTQIKRASEIVRAVLRSLGFQVPVLSKLILASDMDNVKFIDDPGEQVLRRWEVKPYIEKLMKESARGVKTIDSSTVREAILGLKAEAPPVKELDLQGRQVLLGILCDHCNSKMDLGSSRYHAVCRVCGYFENREKCILRSICEFSVLFPNLPPNSANICWFLGDSRLKDYLRRILNKYFKFSKKGRYKIYNLPGKDYKHAFPSLEFRYRDFVQNKKR